MFLDNYVMFWIRRVDRKRVMGNNSLDAVIKEYKIYTVKEANKEDFAPLTIGYKYDEGFMLNNVISDMKRGKIGFCLVQRDLTNDLIELWRCKEGMLN